MVLTFAVAGPVLVIDRSAEAVTLVVAVAVLSVLVGSGSLALTVAVFVMLPCVTGTVTVIVKVALAPDASVPALQVTVPEALVQPLEAETNVTPAGRVSVTTTPVAGLGPLLLAVTVYVMVLPATAEAGPVFVIDRSAEAVTLVVAVAVLSPLVGSGSLALIVAVFVMLPPVAGAVAVMVIVALAPDASVPTAQTTVPEALVQVPWVELADTNVTPAGRVSVTVAPVAVPGPLLLAVRVYVMVLPATAVAGPVFVMATSAEEVTLVVAEAVLSAVVGSASLPVIVAVLVMVPPVDGAVTVIVIVALAPLTSEPTAQVTVPEALVQVPWVELADTNVVPDGRVSTTVTPVALSGPLFLATTV